MGGVAFREAVAGNKAIAATVPPPSREEEWASLSHEVARAFP
jgi:hypothetical protein